SVLVTNAYLPSLLTTSQQAPRPPLATFDVSVSVPADERLKDELDPTNSVGSNTCGIGGGPSPGASTRPTLLTRRCPALSKSKPKGFGSTRPTPVFGWAGPARPLPLMSNVSITPVVFGSPRS